MSLPNASQKTCIATFYQTCMVCAAASDFLLYRFFRRSLEISPHPYGCGVFYINMGTIPTKSKEETQKMKKRVLSLLLLLGLLPVAVLADYADKSQVPWKDMDITSVVAEDGVTTVGKSAFSNKKQLQM